MSTFVKSLKRLYSNGRITDVRVAELLEAGKLTQAEYDFIVGE